MPHDRIICYTTEHFISKTVMGAFAEGCGGLIRPPVALLDGDAAMYGILRGTENIIKACELSGRGYMTLDHGYVGHKHFTGYYRVSRNGRQARTVGLPVSSERWESLGTPLRPWKRTGRNVLVIPLTGAVASFYELNPAKWLRDVTAELDRHTDRPIRVRPKGDAERVPIEEDLRDAWCVVTHSSNVAVDALLAGVPVVTLGESIASSLSWNYFNIESPVWPDREPWAFEVAHRQFTLDELRLGKIDYEDCVYR